MITRRILLSVISVILMGSLLFNPGGKVFASPAGGEDQPPAPVQHEGSAPSKDDDSSSKKKLDPQDIPRAQAYMQSHERFDLPPGKPKGDLTPLAITSFFVQPVLFVASDLVEDPANRPAIDETFQLLRRWYSGALELGGSSYSFQVKAAVVVRASHPFDYYKCPNHAAPCSNYDGIWGNIQDELFSLGFPLWSYGTSHIVMVKGAGGWAGGNSTNSFTYWPGPGPASTAGFAILGDWALDAISGTTNSECYGNMGSACYHDPQQGAVGHELGHTFGLAHAQDLDGSIMNSWWSFPWDGLFNGPVDIDPKLSNDEQGVLRSSLFFSPQSCTLDAQVKQAAVPGRVKAGTQFTVSFTVTNYGYCHWTPTSTVLSLLSSSVWGLSQQPLTQAIYPAQYYTFTLPLQAPLLSRKQTRAAYDCYWQLKDQVTAFGPRMGNRITVTR